MKKLIMTACAIIFFLTLASCGDTYSGRIAVKGHEPFIYLVLITDSGELKITGPLVKKLRECCQGKNVTLRGAVTTRTKVFMQLSELEVSEILDR